jgi:DNA mismatch repair protein MSH6
VKRTVSYAESSDDDEDPFESIRSQRTRKRAPRRAVPDDDDDDAYEGEQNVAEEEDDGTMNKIAPWLGYADP